MNKKIKNHLMMVATAMIIMTVATVIMSCSDDDDGYYYDYYRARGIVTVKLSEAGKTYFQLDNNTTLLPTNLSQPLFGGKEVRALANWQTIDAAHDGYSQAIEMLWADSIRTKDIMLSADMPSDLGDDAVEIGDSWTTCLEDGYLTLCLCTYWGTPVRAHRVELVAGTNKENPYELVLRHDNQGDKGGTWNSSIVAFRLDKLPAELKDGQKITLKWKSFSGPKTTTFTYGQAQTTSSDSKEEISLHGLGTME